MESLKLMKGFHLKKEAPQFHTRKSILVVEPVDTN